MSRKFIAYPFYSDDVPLDLSFLYEEEKPAGKHGFLETHGSEFIFADGTPARFWGTNFNSGCNFPSHSFSEVVSKRLAKIGVNLVRFHQLDAEWSTPNIFQFAKGKRVGNTLQFDPESMERLDYLIHCLKNQGIYIYLDMITYRKFKSGDGVENALLLADEARPYSNFDTDLIELQKKYCYDLWTHVNPYTSLAYKDDPAIILTEIANESDMFRKDRPCVVEPYRTRLEQRYRSWVKSRGLEAPESSPNFSSEDPLMLDFLCETQAAYYREMVEYMHGIGVRIPITGTNWSINAANRHAQLGMDFCDGHTYWYTWKWGESLKEFNNKPLLKEKDSFLPELAFSRLLDRPFFISEWDEPWPNEYRGESPLLLAAVGALQGWSGFAIHTYAYTTMTDVHVTGKEVSSQSIGGVPYREGVFNTWNDPAKFGLFQIAALLFRRGDVHLAKSSIAVKIDDMALTPQSTPALSLVSEQHRVGLEFTEQKGTGDTTALWNEETAQEICSSILSDTGELYRSWQEGIGWISTDRTKAVYGFFKPEKEVTLMYMSVTVTNDFAVIAVSSLTSADITESDNLLLTTVGRSENTGMRFNEDHTMMVDAGKPPILIEVIEAEIKIRTVVKTHRVWSVNAEGFFAGVVTSTWEDGVLSFKTGEHFPSMYYLIQAE